MAANTGYKDFHGSGSLAAGSEWKASPGYVLLGQLIEKVSATKYEEFVHNNIIKPLGIEEGDLGS